jgi:rod shape determining protein RodA
MSAYNYKLKTWKDILPLLLIIFIPFALIVLQKETGSALVFVAFFLVFYREGMNGIFLFLGVLAVVLFVVVIRFGNVIPVPGGEALGIAPAMGIILVVQIAYAWFFRKDRREALWLLTGAAVVTLLSFILQKAGVPVNYNYVAMFTVLASCVYWLLVQFVLRRKGYSLVALISLLFLLFSFSADYLFDNVLQPHQQMRIKVLLNMENDPSGVGYNVNQSKIAIGSGGFSGKGFLNGTQTKLKYVPEQDTDFIFCTVGEEHGFLGSVFVLLVYWLLLMRILAIAERQRETFSRVYAYCVASIFFVHLTINIGMVLGLMPVIGIPLPFFSYGGSSLWGFTILLFILLRLDAARLEMLR